MARDSRVMVFLIALALLQACSKGKPPAVPLSSDDSCALCRMAVSQPRFAAQIALPGGRSEFFDDLGCLLRRLRGAAMPNGAVAYVADFESGRWVEAGAATFVKGPEVSTPMSSGLIAFASRQAAVVAAAKHKGKLLAWGELSLPAHQHTAGGH